jgi:hypothetical protein
LAREAAITIVLAMLGAFVAMLALTFGVVDLYLWLDLKLGIFAVLFFHAQEKFRRRLWPLSCDFKEEGNDAVSG